MRKIKIMLIVLFIMLFTGCSEYGEKRLVKLVTVDKEYISVFYYDYSAEKPSYLVEQKPNKGIRNTMTQLLSENSYDLKLCRYAVCSEEVIADEMKNLFYTLTDSKFSPDIAIIQGETDNWKDYIQMDTSAYPLYSFNAEDKGVTGIVENAEDKSKNIIYQNHLHRILDSRHSTVADILGQKSDTATYIFEADGKTLSAQLENIAVYYAFDKDEVKLSITATLESYKGMASAENQRTDFIVLLQQALREDIQFLHDDRITAQCLNLLWYRKLSDENLAVNVKIY